MEEIRYTGLEEYENEDWTIKKAEPQYSSPCVTQKKKKKKQHGEKDGHYTGIRKSKTLESCYTGLRDLRAEDCEMGGKKKEKDSLYKILLCVLVMTCLLAVLTLLVLITCLVTFGFLVNHTQGMLSNGMTGYS